jgi:MFS family permease
MVGVIADRFSPGRLLSIGRLAQAVLAGLMPLLPPLGALLAVVFVLALADTPLSAAAGRCIPAVVADDDLVEANALRSGVRELGTVLGPPLAGLLFAVSGTRLVLGLDALTFLVLGPRPATAGAERGTQTAGSACRSPATLATGSRSSHRATPRAQAAHPRLGRQPLRRADQPGLPDARRALDQTDPPRPHPPPAPPARPGHPALRPALAASDRPQPDRTPRCSVPHGLPRSHSPARPSPNSARWPRSHTQNTRI